MAARVGREHAVARSQVAGDRVPDGAGQGERVEHQDGRAGTAGDVNAEAPLRGVDDHVVPPVAVPARRRAAVSIAVRISGYVPQRQMLPSRWSTMS